MKRISIAIWSLLACTITINLAYAAPPEDKGKDKDKEPPGQARQEQTPPGQERQEDARAEQATQRAEAKAEQAQARSEQAAERTEARAQAAEVRAEQAALRAERAAETRQERQQDRQIEAKTERGGSERASERRQDREERREQANMQVASLADSLSKLQHARWSYNPHDTRGQGNMGKVDMRDPFGFDKDSGREGQDRGRPIRAAETTPTEPEPTPNPAELTVVDFQVTNWGLIELQLLYNLWLQWADWYSTYYPDWFEVMNTYYQTEIAKYEQGSIDLISVFDRETIDYTLALPEGFDGSTLLVTTRLTSLSTYDDVAYGTWSGGYLDETTGWWIYDDYDGSNIQSIHYDVGQVIVEETQEITLNGQDTFSVSYLPSINLVGDETGWFGSTADGQGFLAELSVTITDPVSGASYTYTYDRDINLYRCPYGIIYDKTTGRAIAGATVTVHNEDGSVVLLEKASNPNVSNPQTTDATGRYNCKLATGKKYYLSVKAPGYQDYKSSLFSERWHIVREDVALTPVKTSLPVEITPAGELMVPALSPAALPVQ